VIESGRRFDAVATFRAAHRLRELRHWTQRVLWQRADLLVLPTVPTTFTIGEIAQQPVERNSVLGRYTQFVNLLDLAALTVPTGHTTDGRPASVSLIGPAFSDALLRTVGAELARGSS
jgi:allophanate hydrolase